MAGESVSGLGRGGMASKLIAAKIATGAGCDVIIAKGETRSSAGRDRARARATPSSAPAARRPRRASAGSRACSSREGVLMIDDGAVQALGEGKSLLPAGIRQIDGRFERGDAVLVQATSRAAKSRAAWRPIMRRDAERIAGQAHRRNRGHSGLSWPGRDDPSRRSGADGKRRMTRARCNRRAGGRDAWRMGAAARACGARHARSRRRCARPRRLRKRPPPSAARRRAEILAANAEDIEAAKAAGMPRRRCSTGWR